MRARILGGTPRRAQQRIRPLWLWPVVTGAAAAVVGEVSVRVALPDDLAALAWPGSVESATAMVQTVASSVITVTTLTFTLTVVALQLASQQFSPRLLREFTRDSVVRIVLSVLVATFVLALTVLRGLGGDDVVPALAALLVLVMGLVSLAALLGFITHLVRILRIDTMMRAVHDETSTAIRTFYPPYGDTASVVPTDDSLPPGPGHVVASTGSGFVRLVDVPRLVQGAARADAFVNLLVRPGDHVVAGSPVAQVWPRRAEQPAVADAGAFVLDAVLLGYERTLEQDAAFGFRQLEDIAVKALSPGINDPVTAVHALGHLGDLLVSLTGCRLGPTLHHDAEGVGRAVVADRDLGYYLELACGQVRRYGAREPSVLEGLHRMLRDVATCARDDGQRREVAAAAELVTRSASDGLLPRERAGVEDMERRVHLALQGDVLGAYTDRSGETRSI